MAGLLGGLYTIVSMESYTRTVLLSLGVEPNARSTAPPLLAIECHCMNGATCKDCWGKESASPGQAGWFMAGVGSGGWLVATLRVDLIAPHCRLSQYMARPTLGAVAALQHVLEYLGNTVDYCFYIAAQGERKWNFFSDSDFSGNKEAANKLRAQCCSIAMHGSMPISWKGGVSKNAFACAEIGEAHADRSSGAAETYAAGEAAKHFLIVLYITQELGMPIALPMVLQLGATAAIAFTNGSSRRSKMAHIDQSQGWVITLRDKTLFRAEHVIGSENIADPGTKLQGAQKINPLLDLLGLVSRKRLATFLIEKQAAAIEKKAAAIRKIAVDTRRQQRLEAYLAANVAGHDYAYGGPGVHVSGVGLDVFPEDAVQEVHAMLGDVRAIQDGEAVYTATGGVYDWLTGLSW